MRELTYLGGRMISHGVCGAAMTVGTKFHQVYGERMIFYINLSPSENNWFYPDFMTVLLLVTN